MRQGKRRSGVDCRQIVSVIDVLWEVAINHRFLFFLFAVAGAERENRFVETPSQHVAINSNSDMIERRKVKRSSRWLCLVGCWIRGIDGVIFLRVFESRQSSTESKERG